MEIIGLPGQMSLKSRSLFQIGSIQLGSSSSNPIVVTKLHWTIII
jgi:hypothetical protein